MIVEDSSPRCPKFVPKEFRDQSQVHGQRYLPHLPAAGEVEEQTRRLEARVRYVNRVALPPGCVRPLDGLCIEDDRTLIATAAAAHFRHWSAKFPRFS